MCLNIHINYKTYHTHITNETYRIQENRLSKPLKFMTLMPTSDLDASLSIALLLFYKMNFPKNHYNLICLQLLAVSYKKKVL